MKLLDIGNAAKAASRRMKCAATHNKNEALLLGAKLLREESAAILAANAEDLAAAQGLGKAQIDRLMLDERRLEGIAAGLETVAALPDPVGSIITEWKRPNGLHFQRVRVPLGVIGVIFESRPNVTADAFALCIKAGNACLLRPGSESFASARAITQILRRALVLSGLPEDALQMVPSPDRELVGEMLRLDSCIDVIIPRGGKSLIARVQADSRVPVLAHLDGNCHVYIDRDADPDMATRVVLNAKMRRTGICGAAETLLVDRACAETHLAPLVHALLEAGCALRGDDLAQKADPRVTPATEEDWSTEYLDAIMAVKCVEGVEQAIEHIERYGSHHTDSIVTNNAEAAERFLQGVDSAIVLHNASTQFADGGEFGMGAEIGIATGRLHARGPVGLEQLTTHKTIVHGNGQIRPA